MRRGDPEAAHVRDGRSGSSSRCASRYGSARHGSGHRMGDWTGMPCLPHGAQTPRSWQVSRLGREFAREEVAQHLGDGDAAPEGGDLDPPAQVGRHIDGEARGERGAGAVLGATSAALIQCSGSAGREAKSRRIGRSLIALAHEVETIDLGGKRSDLARGWPGIVAFEDETPGLRGRRKGDALADGAGEHRGIVVGQRPRGLAGENGARAAAVQDEPDQQRRAVDTAPRGSAPASRPRPSHQRRGCTGISTRSAASNAERISPATRGGPSMTM